MGLEGVASLQRPPDEHMEYVQVWVAGAGQLVQRHRRELGRDRQGRLGHLGRPGDRGERCGARTLEQQQRHRQPRHRPQQGGGPRGSHRHQQERGEQVEQEGYPREPASPTSAVADIMDGDGGPGRCAGGYHQGQKEGAQPLRRRRRRFFTVIGDFNTSPPLGLGWPDQW